MTRRPKAGQKFAFSKSLNNLKKYLAQNKLVVFVLLLLLTFSSITLTAIFPSTHVFEGNLIVEEMSFTYNGTEPKPFLNSIRGISSLEIEGIQPNLTFTGKFTSPSSSKIKRLNTLKINLPDSNSKWIVSPANSKEPSELELTELRLQPNTNIAGLSYDFYRNRLAFSVQPNPTSTSQPESTTLQLSLGTQPLKVSLVGYKSPDIPHSPDEQTQLDFILEPDNTEFTIPITQKQQIYLTLSDFAKNNSNRWFRQKIETKDLQFQRVEKTGNVSDNLPVSTIIEGKVRMAEQERDIKQNQFLMGENPDTPLNVQLIRQIQITSDAKKSPSDEKGDNKESASDEKGEKNGLEVRFSGRTKQIKIGLDKDFPISRIQGSWLDGVLPRDAIIALFSFGAATITYLLSFLIDNASKSASKP